MNASALNLATLTLGSPKPSLFTAPLAADQSMRFVSIQNARRQLVLTLHGTAATDMQNFKGDLSFFLEPAAGELEKLIDLENILEKESSFSKTLGDVEMESLGYMHRPTINADNQLRIKLKTNGDAWRFTCNDASFTVDSDIVKGTKFTVTVAPSFYFSDHDNMYGLFYTLKELDFEKPAKRVVNKRK
jgi:hypothetical protein